MEDNIVVGISENPVIGNEVRDRRTKRVASGFSGLSIEFKTKLPMLVGDYVGAQFVNEAGEKGGQTFEVVQQWLDGEKNIVCVATEVGYFARNISKNSKFTLRDFFGVEVKSITDEKIIANIRESSQWC